MATVPAQIAAGTPRGIQNTLTGYVIETESIVPTDVCEPVPDQDNATADEITYDTRTDLRLTVAAIGKRLTPSFTTTDTAARVWIGTAEQHSKLSRPRFDTTVTYTVEVNGTAQTYTQTLATPVPAGFKRRGTLPLAFQAPDAIGPYEGKLTLTAFNGKVEIAGEGLGRLEDGRLVRDVVGALPTPSAASWSAIPSWRRAPARAASTVPAAGWLWNTSNSTSPTS
mgnify:CR=1 FL=1